MLNKEFVDLGIKIIYLQFSSNIDDIVADHEAIYKNSVTKKFIMSNTQSYLKSYLKS